MSGSLVELAKVFGSLSMLAIGGVNAVLPELQRQAVTVHRWMSAAAFAELFALAQAAPGPNFLVATLVGLRVGGVAGALVATAALIGPTCLLALAISGFWHRFRHAVWRQVAQAGLTPVTIGLVLSASILLGLASAHGPGGKAAVCLIAAATLATRLHPLLLLGAGAAFGAAGLI